MQETGLFQRATVSSAGQITIPASVRAELGIVEGDLVVFIQVDPGRFELVAAKAPDSQ